MLTDSQKKAIETVVNDSLDNAEKVWKRKGQLLVKAANESYAMDSAEFAPSLIPGHSMVSSDTEVVEDFIAVMLDIRKSSEHLIQRLSPRVSNIDGLQRVYYETSALLPAMAKTLKYESGKVTEYLGDGLLALFRVGEFESEEKAIYAANRAVTNCMDITRVLVNSILKDRYNLPDLVIGIGMALSPALINLVGLPGEKQARAMGKCIYYASKLSGGHNQIFVDEWLRGRWPKIKGGTLVFMSKPMKGVDGYMISKK